MNKEIFNITGMSCSACSARVHKAVAALNGVADVSVNLLKNNMMVSYDPDVLSAPDTAPQKRGRRLNKKRPKTFLRKRNGI